MLTLRSIVVINKSEAQISLLTELYTDKQLAMTDESRRNKNGWNNATQNV